MAYFYIYIAFAFFTVLYLVRKHQPKHNIITFILCFWIFYDDVGNREEFKISIPGAPFDLQPMRILFLVCLAFLFTKPFIDKYRSSRNLSGIAVKPKYETLLTIFIVVASLAYVVNFKFLGPAQFYIELSLLLRFYVIYYTVRTIADEGVINTVRDTIIIVCVVSSLVAIVQLVDQSFLRVNPNFQRPAFGGLLRATGVFRDDYIHSYMVFTGLIWVYFTEPAGVKRQALISLFLLSIFIAFMRMGYVVTAIILWHAFYFKTQASNKLKVLVTSVGVMALVVGGFWILTSGVLESSVAQDRMLDEETMELRFQLYEKAIEESIHSVKTFLFGYGARENPAYEKAMYEVTNSEIWASGDKGGWHNLYISFLFFNGFPAMAVFIWFIFGATRYFHQLEKHTSNRFYLIPFYCLCGYAIANLTLSLSLSSSFGIMAGTSAALAIWIRESEINQLIKA